MTTKILKNPAESIRARLLKYAKEHGDSFDRILTRYAIERFLYRLSRTEAARSYVLKGAMLFVTWPERAYRPTGDLDLLGQGDPDPAAITALFTEICQVGLPEDGIRFDLTSLSVEPVREADKYQGVQVVLTAELAKATPRLRVDIGFGDHVYPQPKRSYFPGLLPELPQADLLMYPPETVVAEKFEAMLRFGEANGRIKDFHDIWVATRTFHFELAVIVEAIRGTLVRRGTAIPTEMPVGLADAFAQSAAARGLWSGFLRRSPPTNATPAFTEVLVELRRFFTPVIPGLSAPGSPRAEWDPSDGTWR
jgi:hypothetical protein